MNHYIYRWNLQPHAGVRVELEVSAASAIVAQRTIGHFLTEHRGSDWVVECVSRKRVAVGLATDSRSATALLAP